MRMYFTFLIFHYPQQQNTSHCFVIEFARVFSAFAITFSGMFSLPAFKAQSYQGTTKII